MLRAGDALWRASLDFSVGGNDACSVEHIDPFIGFPHLETTPDEGEGNGVTVMVDTNVSFDIDDAVMELIDLRDVEGKGSELRLFAGKKL